MAYTHSTSKPPPPVQTPAGIDQFADVIGHTPAETGHLTPPNVQFSDGNGHSRKSAALELAQKGLHLIPLCWPDKEGQCACGKNHQGHDIGKAPLTRNGVKNSSNAVRDVWNWWDEHPLANIGVDLDRSGLVAVAPDSPGWHATFQERGLPETATVGSGGGEGHFHFYYRRPKETPLININKAGEYDIQPRGYVVAAGSLHQSGRTYQWITDYQWRDVEDLPDAPDWVLAEIQLKWGSHIAAPEVDVDFTAVELRPGLVGGTLEEWWNGDRCAAHEEAIEAVNDASLDGSRGHWWPCPPAPARRSSSPT